jgi:hypothetical protein
VVSSVAVIHGLAVGKVLATTMAHHCSDPEPGTRAAGSESSSDVGAAHQDTPLNGGASVLEPRLLDSRWLLTGQTRKGGSARVYRASDTLGEFEHDVAVKVITVNVSGDEELSALHFDREQRTLMRLRHPGIVELLGGGRDPQTDERYFVFPWLECDLEGVLAESGALSWPAWWGRYGKAILEALAYAHDMNVAHRDVKPANVMLGVEGEPKLADFGIAKLTDDVNLGRTLRDHQTPPYSPRDYEDERYNLQRDVHAFAAMSVLALAGIDPHASEADPYEVLDGAVAALGCEENVRVILESGLVKQPAHRPESATALLARFDRVVTSASRVGPPVPLMVGAKPAAYIADAFSLRNEQAVPDAVAYQLSEGMALAPIEGDFEDGRSCDGHFNLYGSELKLHIEISGDRGHFVVRNAWRIAPSVIQREFERAHAISNPTRVLVGHFAGKGDAKLIAAIEAGAHEALSDRRAVEASLRRLGSLPTWRRILAASRAILKERERPFPYSSLRRRSSGELEFHLTDELSAELDDVDRLSVLNEDDVPLVVEVSVRGERSISGALIIGRPEQVPSQGRLAVDTQPSRIALRRQEMAMDAVQYGRAYRPSLLQLLVDPSGTRAPKPVAKLEFARADLDDAKRDAVAAAVGSEDLVVVEGPPGTGKTTFIAELVLAELAQRPDSRILLATQTHAALDNALERLTGRDIRMLRIARPGETRVAPAARELLMDAQIEQWRDEGIRSGRRWLGRWAAARGIEVDAIEIAMRLEELAAANVERRRLADERSDLERRLADARAAKRANPDSTAAESLFVLGDAIADLHERLGALRDDGERLSARLVELGEAQDADALRQSATQELRDRAAAAMQGAGADAATGKQLLSLLGDWHARLGRSREFIAAALTRAQVVAATCIGYASVPGAELAEYDLCIIDEASKATATELLVPMSRAQRWVLVGDHRQLPPFVDQALADRALLNDHKLTAEVIQRTLFDDLRTSLPDSCVMKLTRQHRMSPAIGRLISDVFYGGTLLSGPRKTPRWVTALTGHPVAWHTTAASSKRGEVRKGTSLRNPYEAQYIRALLKRLDFYAKADGCLLEVAVLAGYRAQVAELRRLLADDESTWQTITVNVSTIDAFQGREADVTVYSVTRSNPDQRIGFLAERRRLNVALSRARDLLVIVGDHTATTSGSDNPFAEILEHIEDHPEDCELSEAEL